MFSQTLDSVQGNSRLAEASLADEIATALDATDKNVSIGGAGLAAAAIELGDHVGVLRRADPLGAAGLLRGRRATTHWLWHDRLREVGAEPVRERVVRDDPFITAAGVSAGIDMGLALLEELSNRKGRRRRSS